MKCEKCGETENVKHFTYFQGEEKTGREYLCFQCRWPIIDKRLHPPVEESSETNEEPAESGQSGLSDFL